MYDLYSEAYTPFSWHKELFDYAQQINVTLFSSPFDESAVDLLEELDAPAYKIASFELCDLRFSKSCSLAGKPLLMSTDFRPLVRLKTLLSQLGIMNCDILLFHCISSYPRSQDRSI